MIFFTILCLSAVCYAIIYGLFAIRQQTLQKKILGHSLFLYPIIWSTTCIALFQFFPDDLFRGAVFADALRHCLLVFFLIFTYRRLTNQSEYALIAFSVITLSSMVFFTAAPLMFDNTIVLVAFSGIFITLLQLFLIERLHGSMIMVGRNNMKLILVVTVWTIVDLIIYSEVAITQQLNSDHLLWRGILLLTCIPVFWSGIATLHSKPSRLAISRPLAYQGTLFSLAGVYLLGMAIVTYIFELNDFEWSPKITAITLSLSLLPLVFGISSKIVRRNIKVFVNKNLFAAQFDYRKTWLQLNESLNITLTGQMAYDRAIKSALIAIEHDSGAYLSISKGGGVSLLSQNNMIIRDNMLSALTKLTPYFESKKWVIDVNEAIRKEGEYADLDQDVISHLAELRDLNSKWLIPTFRGGEYVALWVVGDAQLKSWNLNWETRDFLSAVAQQIDSYIVNLSNKQTIMEHGQLAAFHQMSAFVIHDLKNVKAQLSMLIQNGEKHKRNPDFIDDLFITLNATQARMDKMLGQLTNKHIATASEASQQVHITLKEVVKATPSSNGAIPTLTITGDETYATYDSEKLKNVLMHLINNAQHACAKSSSPQIDIHCGVTEKYVTISIKDNGAGMSNDFIKNRLFKPFETTKGNSGMGLGVYDARCFAQRLGGDLTVTSTLGEGTQFVMNIQRSGK